MLTQRFQQHRLARSFSGNSAPISATQGRKSSPDFRQNLSAGNRCPIWAARGGFGWPARPYIFICSWPSPPAPARPKPKSKIQTPNGPFGFWCLEFGVWILEFGFWILDFGFRILDFGFWILDFGFWILDFGFWTSLVFVLFVAAPNGPVWILDLGFWILDLGFWILDFGLGLGLLRTDWILHKIFPCHADSGRRIIYL